MIICKCVFNLVRAGARPHGTLWYKYGVAGFQLELATSVVFFYSVVCGEVVVYVVYMMRGRCYDVDMVIVNFNAVHNNNRTMVDDDPYTEREGNIN